MPHKHWTRADERDTRNARTYEALCEVAMRVLERIPEPVEFVCGPISTGGAGSQRKNIAIFKRYIAWLEREGHHVFNQMPFEKALWQLFRKFGKDPDRLLHEFYLPLFESGLFGTFYFIPGWEGSHGARWEHGQAKRLDIRIRYLKKLRAN